LRRSVRGWYPTRPRDRACDRCPRNSRASDARCCADAIPARHEITLVDRDGNDVKVDGSSEDTQRRLAAGELSHKAPDADAQAEQIRKQTEESQQAR
jgi:hypothetical protein